MKKNMSNLDLILLKKNLSRLQALYKKGYFGKKEIPEDTHPDFRLMTEKEILLYYTLPMALNYRRDSFKLWESAKKTFCDKNTNFVFDPEKVVNSSFEKVQRALTVYKLAIQYNKQTQIWITLCKTIVIEYGNDLENLFKANQYNVKNIKHTMQVKNKKLFPYISGNKLVNYWLFTISHYAHISFNDKENICLAVDAHIIKASHELEIISTKQLDHYNVQVLVMKKWNKILTSLHLPSAKIQNILWLWSKSNFRGKKMLDKHFTECVKNSYEKNNYITKFRNRSINNFEKMMFTKVEKLIPINADILDLGCGNGYPYDSFFVNKNYKLTGVDFSQRFISEAKNNNPNAHYYCCDMRNFKYMHKYHCIMALYSIIHLPREEHSDLFQQIYDSLEDNGIFLLTLRAEDAGKIKTKDDFCGEKMIWSYYDYAHYLQVLKKIGFKLIDSKDEKKYGSKEQHNWVILKKEKI